MKKILLVLSGIVSLLVTGPLRAGGQTSITLQLPDGFIEKICPVPLWKDTTLVWKGVEDKRPSPEVGTQEKKGKVLDELVSDPPLAQFLDPILRRLFTQCGMKLLDKGDEEAATLSVEIDEFHAGVEKKLITGKSEAHSRLVVTQETLTHTRSTEIGYEMDAKQVRSKNIKQLTKTLEELLQKTLKEIPTPMTVKTLGN